MERISFVCPVPAGRGGVQAALLARSLRDFGGELRAAPFLASPGPGGHDDADSWAEAAEELSVAQLPVDWERRLPRVPFMGAVWMAAQAEEHLEGETKLLAWVMSDSLILGEPADFLLDDGVSLGCRPVHHKLKGLWLDEPLDDFWRPIHQGCGAPEDPPFAMHTNCEREPIRPYINAGMLVVRPERRLLRTWWDRCLDLALDNDLNALFEQDSLYAIFYHQAVLTATILGTLPTDELVVLPESINYPLNLAEDVPADRSPPRLDDLVTARYDELGDGSVLRSLPMSAELDGWLARALE
ncbi:MAG: hypothetical protein GF320_13500 [Armatimonadia bacterium]|nr:hypothetical protein [Armatimonadia bacterium]